MCRRIPEWGRAAADGGGRENCLPVGNQPASPRGGTTRTVRGLLIFAVVLGLLAAGPTASALVMLSVNPDCATVPEGSWTNLNHRVTCLMGDTFSSFSGWHNHGNGDDCDIVSGRTGSSSTYYSNDGKYLVSAGGIAWYSPPVGQPTSTSLSAINFQTVTNVAPTIATTYLSSSSVFEGNSVSMWMQSTDPGADDHIFTVAGVAAGTDTSKSGTRTSATVNVPFNDPGGQSVPFRVDDDHDCTIVYRTLTVKNIAPMLIMTYGFPGAVGVGEEFQFAALAMHPGDHELFYGWDFDADGLYDDYTGSGGLWHYDQAGTFDVGVLVTDGHGGSDDSGFSVEVTGAGPGAIPEPITLAGLGVMGLCWAAARRRRSS